MISNIASLWVQFQGATADQLASLMAVMPGSDFIQLAFFSLLSGIVLIFLYRLFSFQKALQNLKRRIATVALEPFLFKESVRISLLSPLRLIGLAAGYVLLSLPALLVLAVPVLWLLGHWNQIEGYSNLKANNQVEIAIDGKDARAIRSLQAQLSNERFILTPAVRSMHQSQAWLGLTPLSENATGDLIVTSNGASIRIPLQAQNHVAVLSDNPVMRLLYPGSQLKLPAGIQKISINYPERSFLLFGVALSWVVVFFLISFIAGLMAAKFFAITI